jgi:hypothetical protein
MHPFLSHSTYLSSSSPPPTPSDLPYPQLSSSPPPLNLFLFTSPSPSIFLPSSLPFSTHFRYLSSFTSAYLCSSPLPASPSALDFTSIFSFPLFPTFHYLSTFFHYPVSYNVPISVFPRSCLYPTPTRTCLLPCPSTSFLPLHLFHPSPIPFPLILLIISPFSPLLALHSFSYLYFSFKKQDIYP